MCCFLLPFLGDLVEVVEDLLEDDEADLVLGGLCSPDGPGVGSAKAVFGFAGDCLLPRGGDEVDVETGWKFPIAGTGTAILDLGKRTMLEALPVLMLPAWSDDAVVDIDVPDVVVDESRYMSNSAGVSLWTLPSSATALFPGGDVLGN